MKAIKLIFAGLSLALLSSCVYDPYATGAVSASYTNFGPGYTVGGTYSTLPVGYETLYFNSTPYYFCDGYYFVRRGPRYVIVDRPVGPIYYRGGRRWVHPARYDYRHYGKPHYGRPGFNHPRPVHFRPNNFDRRPDYERDWSRGDRNWNRGDRDRSREFFRPNMTRVSTDENRDWGNMNQFDRDRNDFNRNRRDRDDRGGRDHGNFGGGHANHGGQHHAPSRELRGDDKTMARVNQAVEYQREKQAERMNQFRQSTESFRNEGNPRPAEVDGGRFDRGGRGDRGEDRRRGRRD